MAEYTCKEINPEIATLDNLVAALATDTPQQFFPIGAEIQDVCTIDKVAYPFIWFIVHYGKALPSGSSDMVEGVYLMAKWGLNSLSNAAASWINSLQGVAMNTGGSIYNSLTNDIKSKAISITLQTRVNSNPAGGRHEQAVVQDIDYTFFAPSLANVALAAGTPDSTNITFDYFTPTDNAARVRGFLTNGNTYTGYGLRDWGNQYNNNVQHSYYVTPLGAATLDSVNLSTYTPATMPLPCCFIPKP